MPAQPGAKARTREVLEMANMLYRNHFIIAVADLDHAAGGWNLTVDISWRIDGGRQFQMLNPPHLCKGKDETESFGLKAGKAWIDEQSVR
jgi:hypothetical protein